MHLSLSISYSKKKYIIRPSLGGFSLFTTHQSINERINYQDLSTELKVQNVQTSMGTAHFYEVRFEGGGMRKEGRGLSEVGACQQLGFQGVHHLTNITAAWPDGHCNNSQQ